MAVGKMLLPLAVNDQNTASRRENRQREANGKRISSLPSPSPSPSPILDPLAINIGIPHIKTPRNGPVNRSESADTLIIPMTFPRMLPRTSLRVTQDRLVFLDSHLAGISPLFLVEYLHDMTDL